MTVISHANGKEVYYSPDEEIWRYTDNNEPVRDMDPCGCCGENPERMLVNVSAESSSTGRSHWKITEVDACIAPFVEALNNFGILTANCCCGHKKSSGTIILQDGRVLVLMERAEYDQLSDDDIL